jgi:hypothetical protein
MTAWWLGVVDGHCTRTEQTTPLSLLPAALYGGQRNSINASPHKRNILRTALKILLWALFFAVTWTAALAAVAHSLGLHSTPGIWLGVFGLPGVVIANWIQGFVFHKFSNYLGYPLMFLVNWLFYCSVIQGLASIRRELRKK